MGNIHHQPENTIFLIQFLNLNINNFFLSTVLSLPFIYLFFTFIIFFLIFFSYSFCKTPFSGVCINYCSFSFAFTNVLVFLGTALAHQDQSGLIFDRKKVFCKLNKFRWLFASIIHIKRTLHRKEFINSGEQSEYFGDLNVI